MSKSPPNGDAESARFSTASTEPTLVDAMADATEAVKLGTQTRTDRAANA